MSPSTFGARNPIDPSPAHSTCTLPEAPDTGPGDPPADATDECHAPRVGYRMSTRRSLLNPAREQELFAQCRNGNAQARQTLIEAHLWLVAAIASQYAGRGIEWEDLVGEGCLGVIHALGKFDPARGCRFATYAAWWIREAIHRHLMEKSRTVRLPAPVIHTISACAHLNRRLYATTGHEPSMTELAWALDQPVEKVQAQLRYQEPAVSLDVPAGPEATESLVDRLPDETGASPEQQLTLKEAAECLVNCLRELPARDQALLAQRFGLHQEEEQTRAQIAAAWNLSCSRLHIIEARALARLRSLLRQRGLARDLLPGN